MVEQRFSKRDVANSFAGAAQSYDAAAVLQREVADRLLERLDYIKLAPNNVIDLGCGTGYCLPKLKKQYPKANIVGLDIAEGMLKVAQAKPYGWRKKPSLIAADGENLPFANASIDLIFSNFALQWYHDLKHTFDEFNRVLRPGGLLIFTTFGPDTLKELKHAWNGLDTHQHVNDFIDMHDVGDALVQSQFADPVMDAEFITMEYTKLKTLLKDLKAIGAHNINHKRHHGLTGKNRFRRFEMRYEALRNDQQKLPATYEVVYGHAFATDVKQRRIGPQQFAIPIDQIGGRKKQS